MKHIITAEEREIAKALNKGRTISIDSIFDDVIQNGYDEFVLDDNDVWQKKHVNPTRRDRKFLKQLKQQMKDIGVI